MEDDTKLLIKDYYDISIVDKLETFEDKINRSIDLMDKQIEENKQILVKINNNDKSSNIELLLNQISNKMEEINKKLSDKIDDLDKKIIHNIKLTIDLQKELNSVKSHVATHMLNNSMEITRLVNSNIRSNTPMHFHASKSNTPKLN
jgi:hypothetical protein